jgi:hypothetical protein
LTKRCTTHLGTRITKNQENPRNGKHCDHHRKGATTTKKEEENNSNININTLD